MKILATPKIMSDAEALSIARKGGNAFGRVLYGSKDITLKLLWLESREVILRLNYQPAPLMKWLGKGEYTSQNIRMIVEGTRCTASYAEHEIQTRTVDVPEDSIQKTEYPDDKIVATAKRPALRMVRRQIGKTATAELVSMRSIYRPYYIAFYGEYEIGKRVRYLPIPADGNKVSTDL